MPKKMSRIGGILLLAGTLVLGAPCFLGSPSARDKTPRGAGSAVQAVKEKAAVKSAPSREEEIFYRKALGYHREKKLNYAIQMYLQVVRENPDHREARLNLSSAFIQLGAYSDAHTVLKQLAVNDDANPDVLINLAIAEIGLGRPAQAIHLLDTAALKCTEPRFDIFFHRAVALSRLGRLNDARISYNKAEKLDSSHNTLNLNLAIVSDKLHRYNEAVQYYGKYLQGNSALPPVEKKDIEDRIRSLLAYLDATSNRTEVDSTSLSKRSRE